MHPSHGVKIYVASKPIDFSKGHDELSALVQSHVRKKTFDGVIYVFLAERADRLKLICWDGTDLVMAYKRLEQHVFRLRLHKQNVTAAASIVAERNTVGLLS